MLIPSISTINLLNSGPKIKRLYTWNFRNLWLPNKLPFDVKEKPNPMSPYAGQNLGELFSV